MGMSHGQLPHRAGDGRPAPSSWPEEPVTPTAQQACMQVMKSHAGLGFGMCRIVLYAWDWGLSNAPRHTSATPGGDGFTRCASARANTPGCGFRERARTLLFATAQASGVSTLAPAIASHGFNGTLSGTIRKRGVMSACCASVPAPVPSQWRGGRSVGRFTTIGLLDVRTCIAHELWRMYFPDQAIAKARISDREAQSAAQMTVSYPAAAYPKHR